MLSHGLPMNIPPFNASRELKETDFSSMNIFLPHHLIDNTTEAQSLSVPDLGPESENGQVKPASWGSTMRLHQKSFSPRGRFLLRERSTSTAKNSVSFVFHMELSESICGIT